jgi:hypothetical protein
MATASEKMRDSILAALREGKQLTPYAIDLIAKRWKVDKKYNRQAARYEKQVRFRKQREELIARGTSAPEADKQLYRAAGRASPEAFNRWIRGRGPRWRVRLLTESR